jgi:hypothetical protein
MPLLKMRLLFPAVLIWTGTAVSCEFQTAEFSGVQSAIRRAIIAYRCKKPQSFDLILMAKSLSKLRLRNSSPHIVECARAAGRVCPIQKVIIAAVRPLHQN